MYKQQRAISNVKIRVCKNYIFKIVSDHSRRYVCRRTMPEGVIQEIATRRKDANAFSGSRVLAKKKKTAWLRNADGCAETAEAAGRGGICHRAKINGARSFHMTRPVRRAPFSGRIVYFYAWHGHRRIRCQSPRESWSREEDAKVSYARTSLRRRKLRRKTSWSPAPGSRAKRRAIVHASLVSVVYK